jgi:hypothetical protein
VMKHFLKPGDTIRVRFGDRRFGSPGVRLQTYCEAAFEFRVFVDALATYDYVALPDSPTIAIRSGPPTSWQAVVPTLIRAGDELRLAIRATDKWGNVSNQAERDLRLEPNPAVEGLPETISIVRGQYGVVVQGLRIDVPGNVVIKVRDSAGRDVCRSNPVRVAARGAEYAHYWGDTHGQSNETLGTNNARQYFEFGRDRAFLDVIGHQGNDFQITGKFWRELNALTKEFDVAGKFVCIPGYEWSANTAVGGDRNVHYRHEDETIHRSSHAQIWDDEDNVDEETDCHTAHDLFRKLGNKDCVVVAHVGGRYADVVLAHDGRVETAVEVHSAWGTFEWILRDAFEKDYRVGVVCNSDGHKGRPGADFPGASFFGATGGLTCFLAPRLDRQAIFEAMRLRRHYGTTGNRMFLDVTVHLTEDADRFLCDPKIFPDAPREHARRLIMGDIARIPSGEVQLVVHAIGSAPIERLDIFDGLDFFERVRPYGKEDLGRRIRIVYEGAEYRGRARTTIWDGTLNVAGNAIRNAEMINNWNLDRGIQTRSESEITWKAVTTGNFGVIDLTLADPDAGHLSINTRHVQIQTAVADIGIEDRVFEAGGLDRRVRLYRLPERMRETEMVVSRWIKLHDDRDTRLFVVVTQEDGHRAWSSPIYLFRDNAAAKAAIGSG